MVVPPTHIELAPVIDTIGAALTVTGKVDNDEQPVVVDVKINVADPTATPVTTPPFVTVAMALLLLAQVPPVEGDKVVVPPIHIDDVPEILTVGLG